MHPKETRLFVYTRTGYFLISSSFLDTRDNDLNFQRKFSNYRYRPHKHPINHFQIYHQDMFQSTYYPVNKNFKNIWCIWDQILRHRGIYRNSTDILLDIFHLNQPYSHLRTKCKCFYPDNPNINSHKEDSFNQN